MFGFRKVIAGFAVVGLTVVGLTPAGAETVVEPQVSTQAVDPGVFCGFVDVPYDAFFTTPTCWLKERNITTGTSPTEYSPAGLVTRAQMAAFLWRAVGEPAAPNHVFKDESNIGSWARAATDWLYAQNITRQDPFNPTGTLTRAEMAVWLWKAAGSPAAPNRVFKDEAQIPASARVATDWLYQQGITTNDPYNPFGNVNRAQMSAFLHRYTGNQPLSADTLSNTDGSALVGWIYYPSLSLTINAPLSVPVHGGVVTINWGDGVVETFDVPENGDWRPSHKYGVPGYYRVKVTGNATGYFHENSDSSSINSYASFESISSFGNLGLVSLSSAFYERPPYRVPKILPSTVKILDYTFSSFESISFNDSSVVFWDTSNVTSMTGMFHGARSFNQNISSWNTAKVTDMGGMFVGAEAFNQPIGNWNTANVTDMSFMFSGATAFNQPLNNWNTGNVTNMRWMFEGATSFNQPIGNWNTAKVTDMGGMFRHASAFNQPIGNWNTANVTDMASMFENARGFNQPLSGWNTAKVTNMGRMFMDAPYFNQNVSNWNVTKVENWAGFRTRSALSTANTPAKFR